MDKFAKLGLMLKEAGKQRTGVPITPVMCAEVISIEGNTCTVKIGELELTEVRLKVIDDESEQKLLIIPVIGSMVLVASLSGDLKDLAVLQVDKMQQFLFSGDGLKVHFDTTDKKVEISNNEVSLKGLLEELTTTLKGLKVFTPSGPSGTPLPTTIEALEQFEINFKKLLK